jgi:hypothetical protein
MDFALLLQFFPSLDAGHAFSKFSRALLQNSLSPLGETVSSCDDASEPAVATHLNCCLSVSQTGSFQVLHIALKHLLSA